MKKILIIAVIFFTGIFFAHKTFAQEQPTVNYNGEVIIDSDLDGLTDKGEQDIYGTDPQNPDTDNDGVMDSAEVIRGSDPLDANDPSTTSENLSQETPWAWYVTRAAGLIGFIFLWLTILLGLSIRNPLLKKIVAPVYSFDAHCFLAVMAVFWALVHGTSLLFDQVVDFGVKDIAIPFFSKTEFVDVNFLALGIMAFYMLLIMTVTSYLRNHIKHWIWRALHFLHPVAFVFIVIHGYRLGTDMKNVWIGGAFRISTLILILLYLSSLIFVLWHKFRAPSAEEILNRDAPKAQL
ncbi:MAG: hypothetical protein WC238_03000 [Parcubacteria group bacterium]|jgi:hypothetical protein